MARISKEGIDYFPMDGDFLNNRKVRRLIREHGPEAIAVVMAVFATTYSGKGYYMEWNEDVCFDLSEQTNTKTATVQAIIASAMHQQLFDAEMFKQYGILTSERIQKQYLQCTQKRKKVTLKEEYRLIASPQPSPKEREEESCESLSSGNDTSTGISSPQTTLWGEETPVSDTEMQQSKGKERESKGKEKKTTPTPPAGSGQTGDGPNGLEGGKEEEWIVMDARKVPAYCLNKRTHNYDGLLHRLNQIHVTDVKTVSTILKYADYGRLGHPLWGIISYNNWPTYGIKFPGKYILAQLKGLEEG